MIGQKTPHFTTILCTRTCAKPPSGTQFDLINYPVLRYHKKSPFLALFYAQELVQTHPVPPNYSLAQTTTSELFIFPNYN
jgi:hypothetical protein